jgi:hypothetical protein
MSGGLVEMRSWVVAESRSQINCSNGQPNTPASARHAERGYGERARCVAYHSGLKDPRPNWSSLPAWLRPSPLLWPRGRKALSNSRDTGLAEICRAVHGPRCAPGWRLAAFTGML